MPAGIEIEDLSFTASLRAAYSLPNRSRSAVGEAHFQRATLSPMTPAERDESVTRLSKTIVFLMEMAHDVYINATRSPRASDKPEYICRLSTNEFFFYTREPLNLTEFERLQNEIAQTAKTLPSGIQFIFGSFAVTTDDNKVMNVVPHITCGPQPEFHFIVKNFTSPVDFKYETPDGTGNTTPLTLLSCQNLRGSLPNMIVDGITKELTFNNIVTSKTPEGTPFLTAVDICVDHHFGVAKRNIIAHAIEYPEVEHQLISHVVVSNTVSLKDSSCIDVYAMHVDPVGSANECKWGVEQARLNFDVQDYSELLDFGIDPQTQTSMYSFCLYVVPAHPLVTLAENRVDWVDDIDPLMLTNALTTALAVVASASAAAQAMSFSNATEDLSNQRKLSARFREETQEVRDPANLAKEAETTQENQDEAVPPEHDESRDHTKSFGH